MSAKVRTALAVGALVAAEIALGILLFIRGTEDVQPVNPWRVGDGFPMPPDCSIADESQLKRMLGDHGRTDKSSREDNDPVRVCTFRVTTQVKQDFKQVELTMRSRIGNGTVLEIHRPGPSGLEPYDNMSIREHKRYYDEAGARFTVDNLEVLIRFQGYSGYGNPPPEDRGRHFRAESTALAKQIQAKLVPRNKTTGPTPTR
jgi:hypothetical protein